MTDSPINEKPGIVSNAGLIDRAKTGAGFIRLS
jgi:hypothetical protein